MKKILILLLSTIALNNLLFSMTKSAIVDPYEPSIFAKNSTLTNLGTSGLAYYGFKKFAQKILKKGHWTSRLTGLIGLGTTQFYNYYKKPDIVDSCIVDPIKLLKHNYKIRNQHYNELKNNKDVIENSESGLDVFTQITKDYEQKNPIFQLGECTAGDCALTRIFQPQFRQAFEQRISSALYEKTKNIPNRSTQYTSLGSGGLFQDFVILVKTLAQNPTAKISLHFIDKEYTPYVGYKDIYCKNRTVEPSDITFDQNLDKIVEHARKNWSANEEDENILKKYLKAEVITRDLTYKEFLRTLKETFPKSELELNIHDSAKSYSLYIFDNKIPFPDVLAAADIADEMSRLSGAPESYNLLSKLTLRANPDAYALWLEKDGYKIEGLLINKWTEQHENNDNMVIIKDNIETLPYQPSKTVSALQKIIELKNKLK